MPDIELDELIEALSGIKKRKNDEAVSAALNRKFSMADLKEAWANATPEERAEFRELFGGTPAQVASEDEEAKPAPESETKPKPKPKPKAEEKPKRSRQGRKAGQVYAFDVDERGQVIPLDVARVYSGDDEDDEVEIPETPEDDDAGEAA